MTMLKQTLIVVALVLAPLAVVSAAGAAEATCEVGFTGPDTNNMCVSTETYACEVENDTTVNIINTNTQVAISGDVSGDGTQTGSATNDNDVTFNVTVTNGEECVVMATIPATPAPTSQPEEAKETVPAPEKPVAPVLATTSGNSVAMIVAAILGMAVVGLAALKLVAVYIARR